MTKQFDPFSVIKQLDDCSYYSISALQKSLKNNTIDRLPISLKIVLESVLRNCDGKRITEQDVRNLAQWDPAEENHNEIPFVVSRVILQDFTGVPAVVDLATMRDAAKNLGFSGKGSIHPKQIKMLNEVFTPSETEIEHARKIVDEFEKSGKGLLVIDGKLIERPVLREMQRKLSIVERIK